MTRARSRRPARKRKRKALAKPAKVEEPSLSPESRIIELMAENASLREWVARASRRDLDEILHRIRGAGHHGSALGEWSEWRPFPDPTKGGFIVAPLGPGCYELRLRSGPLVLFGSAGHVAYRMTSLHPSGAGTRRNSEKRNYVGDHLPEIEYRVIALASRDEARAFERRELLSQCDQYIFKT
jgi:hypothetical protein